MTGRELLLGSAFHLAREGDGGRPGLAAWGRVTVGGFDGEAPADDGNVRIDGNVTTGILGTDAEWTLRRPGRAQRRADLVQRQVWLPFQQPQNAWPMRLRREHPVKAALHSA